MERNINKKDVILGLIMLGLSGYILFGNNVIVGNSIFKEEIIVARAEFYLKFLSVGMMIISVALIMKTLKIFKVKDQETTSEPINNIVKLSFVALIIYVFILKPVGFFISSFLLVAFLSYIIRLKENNIDLTDKKSVIKSLIISCIFSLTTVLIIMFIFTRWLKVVLP